MENSEGQITQIPMKFNEFTEIPIVKIKITKIPFAEKKSIAMKLNPRHRITLINHPTLTEMHY